MEGTRVKNSKNELRKSVGREDDGPHFSATNNISSGDNCQANTLIEYDNDETLEIKEDIIPAQERYQSGNHNLLPDINHVDKKSIFFHNKSGGRTFIHNDNGETLEIKEEIIQDQEIHQSRDHILLPDKNHPGEKSTFSDKNSGGRTLIEYDNDETLEIKEEIIQDEESYQIGDYNLLSAKNHLEEKFVFCDNNAGYRTLIEYDNDETLEIKEETVQDRESTAQTCNKKYELEVCDADISAGDIFATKNLQCTPMKQKKQESKQDKKKELKTQPRYNCTNCTQSYTTKGGLNKHERSGHASVAPHLICDVYGYKTNFKSNLSRHSSVRHLKKSTTSQTRHKCDKCSRGYRCLSDLKQHDSVKHAAAKPQFTCDICSYKTKRKYNLSTHISLCHFKKATKSQARHNCRKCSLSYSSLKALSRHDRLKHAAVKPKFICDVCSHKADRKYDLSIHISSRHFKNSRTSETRHNWDKCSQGYGCLSDLKRHGSLKHAAAKAQFICDVCSYKTNRKYNLSTHISLCHFKKSTTSQARHNCPKCSLSYSSLTALSRHDRLKHAAVKPQFICDFCSYKTNRKHVLSTHITLRHFKKASQARHNCDKCSRSYSTIGVLNRHKRLKHPKE